MFLYYLSLSTISFLYRKKQSRERKRESREENADTKTRLESKYKEK